MRGSCRFYLFIWLAALLVSLLAAPAQAQTEQPQVVLLRAEGPVSPTMYQYIRRGIRTADRQRADLIILQLNTPGGFVSSMTAIVQEMRASRVPIVVYVAPPGSMAASAGTIITLAGHASAMAPETIIGAASPVDASGADLTQTMEAKEKEAMRALVRTLAAGRSPAAIALAEATVEEARAVSAQEALAAGLVDFIALDLADLLAQLDGQRVRVDNQDWNLHTTGAVAADLPLSILEQVLSVLANPNIVFLLLNIGVWAVLIELSSPGGWVAGFIGVACLALATYGLGVLPVNGFGLVFLVTAFVLFIIDVKAPTHGALTVAGVASLFVSALVLFDIPELPGLPRISPFFALGVSLATAVSFAVIISFAVRAQRAPVRTGQEGVLGRVGTVRTEMNPRGTVHVGGELWSAERVDSREPLPAGSKVEVVKVQGITLLVRKVDG